MEIFCNSSESILRSKKSSNIFSSIAKIISPDNFLDLLKIFNKVKSLSSITEDEEKKLIDFITSEDFKKEYEKIRQNFTGTNQKIEYSSYGNLLTSLYGLIQKSRFINILEEKTEGFHIEGGKKYIRINKSDNPNYIFLEVIDEFGEYFLGVDFRSGKYKVVNSSTNEVVLESNNKISFKRINSFVEYGVYLEGEFDNDFFCGDCFCISFSKQSTFYESRFSLFIIDPTNSIIYKIDKVNHKQLIINLSGNILEVYEGFILYFVPPLIINANIILDGSLNLYSLDRNKDVISHIHIKHYLNTGTEFIALSGDLKSFYIYNFNKNKLTILSIQDLGLSEDILTNKDINWKEILEKIKETV